MKQLEAPKQTATINGLGLISKFVERAISMGVIIIAIALFDINAEKTTVETYSKTVEHIETCRTI